MSKFRAQDVDQIYKKYEKYYINNPNMNNILNASTRSAESQLEITQLSLVDSCFKHRTILNIYNAIPTQKKLTPPYYFNLIQKNTKTIVRSTFTIVNLIKELYQNPESYVESVYNYLQANQTEIDHFITQTFPSLYAYFSEEHALEFACNFVEAFLDKYEEDFEIGKKFVKVLFEGSYAFHNFLWTNFHEDLIGWMNLIKDKSNQNVAIFDRFKDNLQKASPAAFHQFRCLSILYSHDQLKTLKFFIHEIIIPSFIFHSRLVGYNITQQMFEGIFSFLNEEEKKQIDISLFTAAFSPSRYVQSATDSINLNFAGAYSIKILSDDYPKIMKILSKTEQVTLDSDKLGFIYLQILMNNNSSESNEQEIPKNPGFDDFYNQIYEKIQNPRDMISYLVHYQDENPDFVKYALIKLGERLMKQHNKLQNVINIKKATKHIEEYKKLINAEINGIYYGFASSKFGKHLSRCSPGSFISDIKKAISYFKDFPDMKVPIIITKLNAGLKSNTSSVDKFMKTVDIEKTFSIVRLNKSDEIPTILKPYIEYHTKLINLLTESKLGHRILLFDEMINNINTMSKIIADFNFNVSQKTIFMHILASNIEDRKKFIESILIINQICNSLQEYDLSVSDELFSNFTGSMLSWLLNSSDYLTINDDTMNMMMQSLSEKL